LRNEALQDRLFAWLSRVFHRERAQERFLSFLGAFCAHSCALSRGTGDCEADVLVTHLGRSGGALCLAATDSAGGMILPARWRQRFRRLQNWPAEGPGTAGPLPDPHHDSVAKQAPSRGTTVIHDSTISARRSVRHQERAGLARWSAVVAYQYITSGG
jgi:hypothetical protein